MSLFVLLQSRRRRSRNFFTLWWQVSVFTLHYMLRSMILRNKVRVFALDFIVVFSRESSYCFQRVLAIAILSVRPSVCLSVCPFDRHTSGTG